MRHLPLKILYFLLPVIFLLNVIIDVFLYYSGLNIPLLENFQEILILSIILGWYFIARSRFQPGNYSIAKRLGLLSLLVLINYVVVFTDFTVPLYSPEFPPRYQSASAILFATVVSLMALLTLVPILMILHSLIFYRQKRRTLFYFNMFLLFMVLTAISVFLTKQPLEFQFTTRTLPNDICMLITIVFIMLLSFHNDWATYLPRKEKIIYAFTGIVVFVAVANLFDYVYKMHLPAFSLTLATFGYVMWFFLLFYAGFAVTKLLVHLPTARAFDRKIKEVNSLYDLARLLNTELNFERLTDLITRLTAQVLESQSTWLELFEPDKKRLKVVSQINLTEKQLQENPFHTLDGLNQEILKQKRAVLIHDVSHHKAYRYLLEWKPDARTLIAAPLFSNRGELMGIIYATKTYPYGFDFDDTSLLEGFASQAAIALENTKLLQESLERERLKQELKVAREVQLKLLPQENPIIPGFQIASYSLTAYEVGGDYYDFFEFKDGVPGLIIGDVSGKGTSAAFYMAEFKGVIQTLAKTLNSPSELARKANAIFYKNIERRSFISAIMGKIDSRKGRLTFVRAGHVPVIFCSAREEAPRSIQPPGLAIGLDRGPKFDAILKEHTLNLSPGDTVLFYTDGLTEARNASGEEFGEERLCNLVKSCRDKDAEAFKEQLLEAVLDFVGDTPLHDDFTVLVIKYVGNERLKA